MDNDNDPKISVKETRNGMVCNGQVNYLTLNLNCHAFQLLRQAKVKMPLKEAGIEDSYRRGLAEHHQE